MARWIILAYHAGQDVSPQYRQQGMIYDLFKATVREGVVYARYRMRGAV